MKIAPILIEGETMIIFSSINVVVSENVAVACSYSHTVDDNGVGKDMVISVALDPEKTAGKLTANIFLPYEGNYKSLEHMKMLNHFSNGDPFVLIQFYNLNVWLSDDGNYYGKADSFNVTDVNSLEELTL